MKLIPESLKGLSKLASTDQTRYMLNGVSVVPVTDKRASFTVTDGHQLLSITQTRDAPTEDFPSVPGFTNGEPDKAVIIPDDAWPGMFAGMPKRSRTLPILQNVAMVAAENGVTVATTDLQAGAVTTIKTIDGTFPNFEQVLSRESGKVTVFFNVHLLKRVFSVLSDLMKDGGRAGLVRLDLYDELRPVRVSALDHNTGLHYAAAIMPMRGDVAEIPLTAPTTPEAPVEEVEEEEAGPDPETIADLEGDAAERIEEQAAGELEEQADADADPEAAPGQAVEVVTTGGEDGPEHQTQAEDETADHRLEPVAV
jgi:hypothetical protein